MSRLLKKKHVDNAFLGFLPMVKKENMAEKYKGKSDLSAIHLWREDLLEEIKAMLKNRWCFPKALVTPTSTYLQGQKFKIELEDDTPQVHWQLYKLSPLKLVEANK